MRITGNNNWNHKEMEVNPSYGRTGLPRWLSGNKPTYQLGATRDVSSINGSGRSLGEEYVNLLQYYCWDNPMDRGAWWATVKRVTK